jgi:predicted hydrocarbon binding protein
MNRSLLEEMLKKMKKNLREGKDIGTLKIGALYALGSQLEAIFYFIGHELGSKIDDIRDKDLTKSIIKVAEKNHLGHVEITEEAPDHIAFKLENCSSCRQLIGEGDEEGTKVTQGFCSFEAGLFAGMVERLTNKHCFAQETSCALETNTGVCEFIIVIPQE